LIIRVLGAHNAESNNTKLVSLIIDDVIAIDAGSLASELTFTEQKKIKSILLTHGHYDHIRGVPSFAFNNTNQTTKVFATPETLRILSSHLVDGVIYPRFTKKIPFFLEKPSLKFIALEPFKPINLNGYKVTPLPVNHTINTVGFEVISKNNKKVFYTGDTGPGLSALWDYISPQVVIWDLTFPNSLENRAINSAHLCPRMLKNELLNFYQIKKYYPRIYLIHLSPKLEKQIKKEIKEISKELDVKINITKEGEKIEI
jgi:phosphoribosyl 1,2-cyclic phosphodiesterase